LRKVGGLSPNKLDNASGFSLPPIKTDCHHVTVKLLSMMKNYIQTRCVVNATNAPALSQSFNAMFKSFPISRGITQKSLDQHFNLIISYLFVISRGILNFVKINGP
jgi:hypothetical protein